MVARDCQCEEVNRSSCQEEVLVTGSEEISQIFLPRSGGNWRDFPPVVRRKISEISSRFSEEISEIFLPSFGGN